MSPYDFFGRRETVECRRSTSSLHRLRAETLQFRQNPSFSSFLVTLRRIYSCCYTLNKLDAETKGTTRFIETLGPSGF